MGENALTVRLQVSYGERSVLEDVSFELRRGEVLGLVGTSGAGKSTLVLALLGLVPWRGGKVKGEVLLDGRNLLRLSEREVRQIRGRRIALIPQSPMTALNSAVSLRTHFTTAWKAHETESGRVFDNRLEEVLKDVQLPASRDFLARRPSQISVGQAQRICIALALLHKPEIIIADEPTSALDPVTQAEIVRLLGALRGNTGTTLLYISHDLITVIQLCDRLAVLSKGRIVECLSTSNIEQAQHVATQELVNALPVPPHLISRHVIASPRENSRLYTPTVTLSD